MHANRSQGLNGPRGRIARPAARWCRPAGWQAQRPPRSSEGLAYARPDPSPVRRTGQQTLLLLATAPSRLRAGKKICSRSVAHERSQHALFEALLYDRWGIVELGAL